MTVKQQTMYFCHLFYYIPKSEFRKLTASNPVSVFNAWFVSSVYTDRVGRCLFSKFRLGYKYMVIGWLVAHFRTIIFNFLLRPYYGVSLEWVWNCWIPYTDIFFIFFCCCWKLWFDKPIWTYSSGHWTVPNCVNLFLLRRTAMIPYTLKSLN